MTDSFDCYGVRCSIVVAYDVCAATSMTILKTEAHDQRLNAIVVYKMKRKIPRHGYKHTWQGRALLKTFTDVI